MSDTLTLTRPDDWHLHVRDGAPMAAVVPATARASAACCALARIGVPLNPVTWQNIRYSGAEA